MQLQLDKALIFANQSFKTKEEILSFMADKLHENGYVKESYKVLLNEIKKIPFFDMVYKMHKI